MWDGGAASPADRLAALAARGGYTPGDALTIACVGALCTTDALRPWTLGPLQTADAATGLVLTAGAVWARGVRLADTPDTTTALIDLARRALADHAAPVLLVVESLLAAVDPEGAWNLIEQLLGAPAAVEAALGLDVAAHLELDRAELWSPPIPCPVPFREQLTADRIARAAIAGRPLPRGTPSPAELLASGLPAAATPARTQVLLVATAAADPTRALRVVDDVLQRLAPGDLGDALRLVAILLHRAGLADEVAASARREAFVAEQCTWVAAAAAAGALSAEEVVTMAPGLSARVDDELDPGREWVAGLPLVEALLSAGAVDAALPLAKRWQLGPGVIATRCLRAGSRAAAGALARHPGLGVLLREGNAPVAALPPWWAHAAMDQNDQLAALRDVFAVVEQAPWAVPPGSLADLLGLSLFG
jgi:hypothetical protein